MTNPCTHVIGPWLAGQQWPRCLKCEIEALRQERHQLRNELTAARLENERLRAQLGSIRARCLNLAQWIDNGGDPERSATEASFIALLAKEPPVEPSALPSELHVRGCGAWRGEACTCIQPAVRTNV